MHTRSLLAALAFPTLLATTLSAQPRSGAIRGTILVRGEANAPRLVVSQQQDICGQSVANRHLVIERGRLANALVVLDYKGEADVRGKTVTLRTNGCDFEPIVQVTSPGATLVLKNDDPIMHTVNLVNLGRKLATIELQAEHQEKRRGTLGEAMLLDVQCEFHDWMHAKVWVLDHPYYALTGADGSFEIPNVPTGTYTLKVWHEELGMLAQEVIVKAGQSVTANFAYAR
jgi:hypothetical protein